MGIKEWVDAGKFVTSLTSRGIIILLCCIILGFAAYDKYQLEEKIKQNDLEYNSDIGRLNNIVSNLEKRIEDCNQGRIQDSQEGNKYWRDRVDKLEEEASKNYREIRQINNR